MRNSKDNGNHKEKNIEVFTACGDRVTFDLPDYCVPVETGSFLRTGHIPGYHRDDEGENISERNHEYSELTVLYWGWKNSHADIKGLCHYRRFFHHDGKVYPPPTIYIPGRKLASEAVTADTIRRLLLKSDVILPVPYYPYPFTVRQDLERYVYPTDIELFEKILRAENPTIFKEYSGIMESRHIPYCNMMIAPADIYNDYCSFLFPLLDLIRNEVNLSGYDRGHQRIFGYLSEVLLPAWIKSRHLLPSWLNMAMIWELSNEEDRKQDAVRIGRRVRRIENCSALSALYHRYLSGKYPEIYEGYQEVCSLTGQDAGEKRGKED